ncbi:MAG: VTT domain-containing protein [Nesterenkonia sp.]|uniref:DedA family protein n=1 Tax=Nesterenkonia marinintestina TaxID=2979865 RepID=UPI0021BE476F|nr:VTT domain-containing protein [Nesterenkonia sp. GX14115]MDO5493589.1 VTT domain-containing protein [Nesterenkonia sp.]
MTGIYEWILAQPLAAAIGLLFVVVFLRAGATYLLGRGAHRLADRGRGAAVLRSPKVIAATGAVNRWGAPVVALSFLTVGFQTALNAAAGLTRMPVSRYLPALIVGGLAWATLYATVGLAAAALWLQLFLHSPWAAWIAVIAAVAAVTAVVMRRRAHRNGRLAAR